MIRLRHDHQIVGFVVLFVPVNVMDNFVVHQRAPELNFSDQTMFVTVAAFAVSGASSAMPSKITVDRRIHSGLKGVSALVRTIFRRFCPVWLHGKQRAALNAPFNNWGFCSRH
jgi:hypothetical protein